MYRPVSIAIATALVSLPTPMRSDTAQSTVAKHLQTYASDVYGRVSSSIALSGARDDVIAEIWDMVEECSEPDWDAYGASSLSQRAASLAVEIVRALPPGIPLPIPE